MDNRGRCLPWHSPDLATHVHKPVGTAVEALADAGLSWEVDLKPIFVESMKRPGSFDEVERHRAVVRDDNGDALGVVGMQYVPVQNLAMLYFVDKFEVPGYQVELEALGEFDGGRRIFVVAKLVGPLTEHWAKVDPIDLYVIMTNTHDGSAAFRLGVLPVRGVCVNQLRLPLRQRLPTYSIPHRTFVNQNAEILADRSARHTVAYLELFEDTRKRLTRARLDDAGFEDFLEQLIPIPEAANEQVAKNRERYRDGVREAYRNPYNRRSKWGALNAVAEWEQWEKPMYAASDVPRTDWLFERLIMDRGHEYVRSALALL